MKALKITLALVAITVLTVSGVQSENVVVENEATYKSNSTPINLLAHNKAKIKSPRQG